ncbi:hypothetical protein AWU82_28040 [Pseudomonas glycinae]|uniref:Uncharacterized protein n=1 Tax=Pseudomonas glycinae TaxID=1785145 RepID=A0ABN5FR74_9PSED|nr:hypothetical protein AWU82_28040 [Pseudomonas glycinae]
MRAITAFRSAVKLKTQTLICRSLSVIFSNDHGRHSFPRSGLSAHGYSLPDRQPGPHCQWQAGA